MNLNGVWTGEYRWDAPVIRDPVAFTLRFTHRWIWRVTGSVQDGPGGMPEEGTIAGWLRGRRLFFQKRLPVFRVAAEGRTVTLVEFLASTGDFRVSGETPHPSIHYEGTVADDGCSAAGSWTLPPTAIRPDNHLTAVHFGASSGSWDMRRN